MGWTFLDLDKLPDPGDIVWCKFPYGKQNGPGPVARPTLVRNAYVRENPETGTLYGSVEVSYGTGNTNSHADVDLILKDWPVIKQCGLHKPTRFALDLGHKKHLFWCEEYFVPPDYLRDANVQIGRLGPDQIEQMRNCLIKRGLITG